MTEKNSKKNNVTINVGSLGIIFLVMTAFFVFVIRTLLLVALYFLTFTLCAGVVLIMPFTKLLALMFPKYVVVDFNNGLIIRNKKHQRIFRAW